MLGAYELPCPQHQTKPQTHTSPALRPVHVLRAGHLIANKLNRVQGNCPCSIQRVRASGTRGIVSRRCALRLSPSVVEVLAQLSAIQTRGSTHTSCTETSTPTLSPCLQHQTEHRPNHHPAHVPRASLENAGIMSRRCALRLSGSPSALGVWPSAIRRRKASKGVIWEGEFW